MVGDISYLPSPDFWQGRRVLVTGHTGFKGSWLSLWLARLGAEITGISLTEPVSAPCLFDADDFSRVLSDVRCDVRDAANLTQHLKAAKPDFVFHLAAQPLVRRSYRQPEETFSSNVQGTVNVLEAARAVNSVQGIVIVTSDKCYLNNDKGRRFVETDSLGGHDPYSASKAAAEMVAAGYRSLAQMPPVYTVRAGNVIGGGDWGEDRLIPDMVRAFSNDQPVTFRNSLATRPWQHVLDCLSGYLAVAEVGSTKSIENPNYNFGPLTEEVLPVGEVANLFIETWGEGFWRDVSAEEGAQPKEAAMLGLGTGKAVRELNWRPHWQIVEAIEKTALWYRDHASGEKMIDLVERDISSWTG
jgi:CDP-glucose 4,6-dehydratase